MTSNKWRSPSYIYEQATRFKYRITAIIIVISIAVYVLLKYSQ